VRRYLSTTAIINERKFELYLQGALGWCASSVTSVMAAGVACSGTVNGVVMRLVFFKAVVERIANLDSGALCQALVCPVEKGLLPVKKDAT